MAIIQDSITNRGRGINDIVALSSQIIPENGLYVSNDYNTAYGYTNGAGYVGLVRRPIPRGQSTGRQFLKDSDFPLTVKPGSSQFFKTTDNIRPASLNPASSSGEKIGKIASKYTKPKVPESISRESEIQYKQEFNDYINKVGNEYNSKYAKCGRFPVNGDVRIGEGGRTVRINNTQSPDFRHYIFTGKIGGSSVELLDMWKPKAGIGTKSHSSVGSVGLSRKK